MSNPTDKFDVLRSIVEQLKGFPRDEQERVIKWACEELGIDSVSTVKELKVAPSFLPESPVQTDSNIYSNKVIDIRALKEERSPATAVEMAVLVAYYLGELAPETEKKSEIETSDITTYFKQASYPLPKVPSMTLVHAKNAGYFESVEKGRFRLNPVGYNLAAHTMGKAENRSSSVRKRTVRKSVVKKVSKKNVKKK